MYRKFEQGAAVAGREAHIRPAVPALGAPDDNLRALILVCDQATSEGSFSAVWTATIATKCSRYQGIKVSRSDGRLKTL